MFSQNINAALELCCSTQNCNLKMLRKWKKYIGKGKIFSVLLTDISKAFDLYFSKVLIFLISSEAKKT